MVQSGWQLVVVVGDQIVYQCVDFFDFQYCGGVWIYYCGVIDVIVIFGEDCLCEQCLYVDIGLYQCCQMCWQCVYFGWLDVVGVYQVGYFYIVVLRQVVDEIIVVYVVVYYVWFVGLDGVYDGVGIFVGGFYFNVFFVFIVFQFLMLVGQLFDVVFRVFIQWYFIVSEKVIVVWFDKLWCVFGEMF